MKKNRSSSIIGPFLVSILLILILSLTGITLFFSRSLENALLKDQNTIGNLITSDIGRLFESSLEDQISLAKAIATRASFAEVCEDPNNREAYSEAQSVVRQTNARYAQFDNVVLVSFHGDSVDKEITLNGIDYSIPDGSIVMSATGNHLIGIGSDKEWSTRIHEGRSYHISEAYLSMTSNTPIFVISVPVLKDGDVVGALVISPKLSYFASAYFTHETFTRDQYIFMFDNQGEIIYHPNDDLVMSEQGREALRPFYDSVMQNIYQFSKEFDKTLNLYYTSKIDLGENSATDWYIIYRVPMHEIDETVKQNTQIIIVIMVIITALITLIVILLTRRMISKPLVLIKNDLENISQGEGDLTNSIDIASRNEIGQIAESFNTFVGTLCSMMNNIKGAVAVNRQLRDNLSTSSEETSAAVHQILSNIISIKKVIDKLVDQTEQAGGSTREINSSIGTLTNQAGSQKEAVDQSTAAVEEMIVALKSMAGITSKQKEVSDNLVHNAEESSTMLDETYTSIQQVNTNIASIMEMTDVIDSISSQTNLLAMNAAIEAAHAGDAGKGFAVVADEIRKLAEDSSASSAKIAGEVKTIVDQIQYSSDNSSRLQEAMSAMIPQIKSTASAFAEINSSTLEMSSGSDQVLNAMSSLSESAEELTSAAVKMEEGTGTVSSNIEAVLELTRTAGAAIEEISDGSNEILSAVTEMQNHVNDLGEKTRVLSQEVDGFKTE